MKPLLYADVLKAVETNAAAFRCRRTLQPAGGPGTKVYPATYSGAKYATEDRRLAVGKDASGGLVYGNVPCVLLDSVPSQANRMEEALQQAIDDGRLCLPLVEVDFSGASLPEPIGKISSLQVPHRLADAILRDSELEGVRFRDSLVGKSIDTAGARNATPIYCLCPTALVFGMWDSTGPKGGSGVKFERSLVSEVIAIDAKIGIKTASRIDPILTSTGSIVLYKSGDHYTANKEEAETDSTGNPILYKSDTDKAGRVSAANLGNVTPSFIDKNARGREEVAMQGGVTMAYAEQTTTLSLIALRRLRFPIESKFNPQVDAAARAVLAALGLCASTLAAENGLDLRSRCLLWPDDVMEWELLAQPGCPPEKFALDGNAAIALLNEAIQGASMLGLLWMQQPLKLTPTKQLVDLVRKGQEVAARMEPAEEEE